MFRFAIFCVVCLAFGAISARAQMPSQSEARFNIAYGPDPVQQLDLCLPSGQPAAQRPAIVMIHGGYWTVGDKSAYAQLCKMAADQGIVAASINYRLASEDPAHRWPAQLVDAQLAVRWLRAHASEFAVDPRRICALGDSAGAHLAVLLAVLNRTAPGDDSGVLPSVSSSVACAVDNFGPSDLSADSFWPPDKLLFGNQQRDQVKDQERAASPLLLIGPGAAPIMIAHGRDDKSVNVDQSVQLADRLKSQRDPVRLVLLNGGHEFAGLSGQEIQSIFQQELDFIKTARPR